MQLEQLISFLERTAPLELAAQWDQSGIQACGQKQQVENLALCLDPDPEIISSALHWGADFILTHHPLSLSPGLPCQENSYTKALRLLLCSGAWLYSAHTSLDVQIRGPAAWLARDLGWQNLRPVDPVSAAGWGASSADSPQGPAGTVGYGILGELDRPYTPAEFYRLLGQTLELRFCRSCGPEPEILRQAAYCPGSGMDLAAKAFAQGADIFISGELKYHQAQELRSQGLVLDVGHFILEERMMQAWALDLDSRLDSGEVQVRFFPGQDSIRVQDLLQTLG
ncbi:MAG: Nif3-like dinuclear metal center hexameric protein [Thermodesulfobacteriota bacterium]